MARYLAVVQFHEVVNERQSDARSHHVHLAVVAVEEAVIQMFQFLFRHTDTVVLHLYLSRIAGYRHAHVHPSAVVGVFHGVAQQVVENFLHLVAVKPCLLSDTAYILVERNFLLRENRHKTHTSLLAEVADISLANLQFQLSCLCLSHFQNLSQHTGKPVDVVVDKRHVGLHVGMVMTDTVGRCRDYGERREQLMRDIGEYHLHLQTVFCAQPFAIPQYRHIYSGDNHKEVQDKCSP